MGNWNPMGLVSCYGNVSGMEHEGYQETKSRRTSGSSGHRYGGMALARGESKCPAAIARRSATPLA